MSEEGAPAETIELYREYIRLFSMVVKIETGSAPYYFECIRAYRKYCQERSERWKK